MCRLDHILQQRLYCIACSTKASRDYRCERANQPSIVAMVCEIKFRWAFCQIHRCISFIGFDTSESDLTLFARTFAHVLVAVSSASLSLKKKVKCLTVFRYIISVFCQAINQLRLATFFIYGYFSIFIEKITTTKTTVLLRNVLFLKWVFALILYW